MSGSFVILLLGLFIAVSAVYTSGGNAVERFADARDDQTERFDAVYDTGINITSVTVSSLGCDVTVAVNNTGSTTLSVAETTLMFDNSPQANWRDGATVGGDATTDLWLPGEQLEVTRSDLSNAPNSTAVVTKRGVTDRTETEGLSC